MAISVTARKDLTVAFRTTLVSLLTAIVVITVAVVAGPYHHYSLTHDSRPSSFGLDLFLLCVLTLLGLLLGLVCGMLLQILQDNDTGVTASPANASNTATSSPATPADAEAPAASEPPTESSPSN
jgi:hypothetical protein